ncbi:MAG: hypothetical protein AB7N76_35150 [Planctomycetota bacterium]
MRESLASGGRPRVPARGSLVSARLPLLLAALLLAGCKAPDALTRRSAEDERAIARARSLAPEVDCLALEFDHTAREVTRARDESYDRVRFRYTPAAELPARLRSLAPTHLFLIVHGWMNDGTGAQQFTSRWVNGLRQRLPAGANAAYVGIAWDSQRLVFHESALAASVLGKRQVAPLVASLRQALPSARITLVGHSLGGRMMLAAADEAPARSADLALLLEAAQDQGYLYASAANAGAGARLIVNVHSLRDEVLELAYETAMRAAALGRLGAERAPGARFPTIPLGETAPPRDAVAAALQKPEARTSSGTRVLNIDATGLIPGHTAIFHPPVFDLAWMAAALAR